MDDTTMIAKGHSLWLIPSGDVYQHLSGIIRRLSAEHNTPVFEPHVTLLSGAMQSDQNILSRTEHLVSGQKPFPITLNTVEHQSVYFITVYVMVELTESLQALHNCANDLFEMKESHDYMPHLSIMYGNCGNAIKEKIIKDIGKNQKAKCTVNSNVWSKQTARPVHGTALKRSRSHKQRRSILTAAQRCNPMSFESWDLAGRPSRLRCCHVRLRPRNGHLPCAQSSARDFLDRYLGSLS